MNKVNCQPEQIDLKLSKQHEEFIAYQKYLINIVYRMYGIPKCLINPLYKETWLDRLERKLDLFMYLLTKKR